MDKFEKPYFCRDHFGYMEERNKIGEAKRNRLPGYRADKFIYPTAFSKKGFDNKMIHKLHAKTKGRIVRQISLFD